MKNIKNIWKISLSLLISGLVLFVVGCSDDDTEPKYDIIYGEGVTDIDGNEYVTVIIGNQEWMAENLRVIRYRNGDDIPTDFSNSDWSSTASGAYAIYPHDDVDGISSDDEMVAAYGKLYNWYAVDDSRGLCPEGWSVPSDDEWKQMENYVRGFSNEAGNALKSCRQVDSPIGGDCDTSDHPRWDLHNTHYGFDKFGFSALPSGFRSTSGSFSFVGNYGSWWSSTEVSSSLAWRRWLTRNTGDVHRYHKLNKTSGYSLRCVRVID